MFRYFNIFFDSTAAAADPTTALLAVTCDVAKVFGQVLAALPWYLRDPIRPLPIAGAQIVRLTSGECSCANECTAEQIVNKIMPCLPTGAMAT